MKDTCATFGNASCRLVRHLANTPWISSPHKIVTLPFNTWYSLCYLFHLSGTYLTTMGCFLHNSSEPRFDTRATLSRAWCEFSPRR